MVGKIEITERNGMLEKKEGGGWGARERERNSM